jgi:chromosomal replication initiation ATPase DnaA
LTYHETQLDAIEIERRLRAYLDDLVQLAGGPVTVWRAARMAMEHLRRVADAPDDEPVTLPTTHPEAIVRAAAAAHGLTADILRGPLRTRDVSMARHHAVWELRLRRPDLPLDKIAAWLCRRDHATMIHSLKTFRKLRASGLYEEERAHVERALAC